MKAKYETLLVGLCVAKYVGVIKIIIHLDSHLAAHELKEMYKVKNDWLRKYTKTYERMKAKFQEMVLQEIPREENKKVNKLA